MPPVRRQPASSDSSLPVVLWRMKGLRRAGFSPHLAGALARDCAYDLHALVELVDRGCPTELAARILAPLDAASRQD
jgi:hypothetical protein